MASSTLQFCIKQEKIFCSIFFVVNKEDMDLDQQTGLHKAICAGPLSHMRPLLAAGADVTVQSSQSAFNKVQAY